MSISLIVKSFTLTCLLSFILVGIVFSQDCSDDLLNMNMDVERHKCVITIDQRKTIIEFLDSSNSISGDSRDFLNKSERYYFLLMMDYAGNPEAYSSDEGEYVKALLRKAKRELDANRRGNGKKSNMELERIKKAEILTQRSFTVSGVDRIDLLKRSLALYREPRTVLYLLDAYYAEQMYTDYVELFSSMVNDVTNGDESYVYSKGYRSPEFRSSFVNFLPLLRDEECSSLLSNTDIKNIANIIPIYYVPYIDIIKDNEYIDESEIYSVANNILGLIKLARKMNLQDVVNLYSENMCKYDFIKYADHPEKYYEIKDICLRNRGT